MALDEPKEEDHVESTRDLDFVLGEEMTGSFNEINIDYGRGFLKRGFQITSDRGSAGAC